MISAIANSSSDSETSTIGSGRRILRASCAAASWSERRIVISAASSGRRAATRPPMPMRACVSSSSDLRSSTTTPPLVETTEPPPSSTLSSSLWALRLAPSQASWARGRASSSRAARSANVRRAPAAGPAKGWARGGSALRISASTSTFSYSWSTR